MRKATTFCLTVLLAFIYIGVTNAQRQAWQDRDSVQLDPNPYDPEKEPDIDMFLSSYKQSNNRGLFRAMIERDILTPLVGKDFLHPERKGAVLTNIKLLSYVLLPVGQRVVDAVIAPELREQRMFYCATGEGTIESKNTTYKIYPGVGIIIPPNVTFNMNCTSDEDLAFYCITENIPADFKPRTEINWTDEASTVFSSNNVHWTHNYKTLFGRDSGLATFRCGPVWFTPMTMSQPHSHGGSNGSVEEIWFSLTDGVKSLLGKELRNFDAGTAYKVPSNDRTPHSNINVSDKTVKVFWFMN